MSSRRAQQPPHHTEFSGHFERTAIAVGQYAVANTYNGTVIQRFAAGTAPRPTRRAPPQRRPPRDPVELFGRVAEQERIDAALNSASAIGVHGPAGVGKTALLKHIADDIGAAWPDGVLYANVGAQRLEDVLQWLFNVFWDTGAVIYTPGALQVGEFLEPVRALVVLDDLDLVAAEVQRLVDSAPACGFALGGGQPPLPERSYPLLGLDAGSASLLFARVLGRVATEVEQRAIDAFVGRVDGLPGYVVTGAELMRDGTCAPSELVEQAGAVLARRRLVALPVEQQQLLRLLAELAPAAVPADLLGPDAEDQLERLRVAGVVDRHSPRYTLAGPFDGTLARDALARNVPHVTAAEFLRRLVAEPERIGPDDVPSAAAALAWGQRAGAHEDVVRAARALAPAMVHTGYTGAWGTVVQLGLTAARHLDSVADEALLLHEQGTRLGCLGDRGPAYEALTRARDIRRQLRDEDGVAVTEHNLRELFGGAGGSGDNGGNGDGGGGGWRPPRALLAGVSALAVVAAITVVALASGGNGDGNGDTTSSKIAATPGAPADTADPTITLVRPLNGARVTAGSTVLADYHCRDRGRRPSVCTGTVPSGKSIDTTEGDHRFRVYARDKAGNDAEKVVTYQATTSSVLSTSIEITSPKDGHTYDSGTRIPAEYRCTNASKCTGDVKVGVPVNGRPGTHDFTVRAQGIDGKPVELSVTYSVANVASEPLVVAAQTKPGDPVEGKLPTVTFSCSGGTAPLTCTATLDNKPIGSPTSTNCRRHTVTVTAADAAGQTKDGDFPIQATGC